MKTALLHHISARWGWILLRGILAILFGLMAFAWPLLTLGVLVLLWGGYVFADGVFALVAAVMGGQVIPRWWLALVGILGMAAGIAIFFWPGLTAMFLLTFIGITAIVRGVFEIVGAIALRKEISNEWMLALGGLASIAFGIVVLVHPGSGAIAMVWVIATYAIAFGLLLVGLAMRLRRHLHASQA